MKTILTLFLSIALVVPLCAADTSSARPYLGVKLVPLEPLLAKHLQLNPDASLMVNNIVIDSPADNSTLDKDDIVIAIEDQPFTDYQDFLAKLHTHAIGDTIDLTVIHAGDKTTASLTLAAAPASSDIKWKYQTAPMLSGDSNIEPSNPDERSWRVVPFDQMPDLDDYFHKFFRRSPDSPQNPDTDENLNLSDLLSDLNKRIEALEKQQQDILSRLPDPNS